MRYGDLVKVYSELESNSKRLAKTHIISELLKVLDVSEINKVVLLLQGKVFPDWDESKLGVSARLVLKAINVATGIDINAVEKEWTSCGDLGIAAENLVKTKKQVTLFSTPLTVSKVFDNLRKLPSVEGAGAVERKIQLIAELLTSASPLEARYVVRTILEELRVGVGEGSIRDAIIWAYFGDKLNLRYNPEENDFKLSDEERAEYNKYVNALQEAYDIANDFGEVAESAKTKGLEGLADIHLLPGKPVKVMLYQKAKDIEEAFEAVGKPAAIEEKYDGFRMQIHKNSKGIFLFTRRLENVTSQFPDVVKIVRENINASDFILDAEIIGIDLKTKKYLPFQNISQRIKRKYDIIQMTKDIPVMVNVFDAIHVNGVSLLKSSFAQRRAKLIEIVKPTADKIQLAKEIVSSDINEAENFYKESLAMGNEGIMIKNLSAPYKPGSRVGYGMKVKPIMETLDLVIIGAEWGEGKRSSWLSSFTIACIDDDGNFLEIGKFGTGVKEKEESEGTTFEQLTELLKPLIVYEKAKEVRVKPVIVVELGYEEIQKSPTYSSGYALRFPRFIRLREDKAPEDASTISQIEEFYGNQRARDK